MKRQRILIGVLVLGLLLALAVGISLAQGPEPPEREAGAEGEVGAAAVDASIPIQGRLTDDKGNPLDGNYSITFRLYDVSSGGTALCEDTDSVSVEDGLFSARMDFCTSSDIDGRQLYLGIKVGSDDEMTDRQAIYPVPYAFSLKPGAIISDTRDGILTVRSTGSGDKDAFFAYAGGTGEAVSAFATDGVGVYASSDSGVGVHSISISNTAVWAETSGGFAAVDGRNTGGGRGVFASSAGPGSSGTALYAVANHADGIAIWGNSDSTDSTLVLRNDGTGDLIRGFSHGDWAYRFRVENDGRTTVPVLEITGGSDLSEQFDVTAAKGEVTPGLVVCIDANHPGKLLVCNGAYDRTVAGVVSGAGGIEPGMVMGQQGSPADGAYPMALTGRVYVWADASYGPIKPGDLLTTSDTPGYAMKVTDYERAQGAIIGKAMSTLTEGRGLILVLVSLQ